MRFYHFSSVFHYCFLGVKFFLVILNQNEPIKTYPNFLNFLFFDLFNVNSNILLVFWAKLYYFYLILSTQRIFNQFLEVIVVDIKKVIRIASHYSLIYDGARGQNRTVMESLPKDFESFASTSFTTRAANHLIYINNYDY